MTTARYLGAALRLVGTALFVAAWIQVAYVAASVITWLPDRTARVAGGDLVPWGVLVTVLYVVGVWLRRRWRPLGRRLLGSTRTGALSVVSAQAMVLGVAVLWALAGAMEPLLATDPGRADAGSRVEIFALVLSLLVAALGVLWLAFLAPSEAAPPVPLAPRAAERTVLLALGVAVILGVGSGALQYAIDEFMAEPVEPDLEAFTAGERLATFAWFGAVLALGVVLLRHARRPSHQPASTPLALRIVALLILLRLPRPLAAWVANPPDGLAWTPWLPRAYTTWLEVDYLPFAPSGRIELVVLAAAVVVLLVLARRADRPPPKIAVFD